MSQYANLRRRYSKEYNQLVVSIPKMAAPVSEMDEKKARNHICAKEIQSIFYVLT